MIRFVINIRTKFEPSTAAPERLTLYVYEFATLFFFLDSGEIRRTPF
jgi:hypothetical protein